MTASKEKYPERTMTEKQATTAKIQSKRGENYPSREVDLNETIPKFIFVKADEDPSGKFIFMGADEEKEQEYDRCQESKLKHSGKIERSEKVLKTCKAAAEITLRICKEDLESAEQSRQTLKEQRDAALVKARSLRKLLDMKKTHFLLLEKQITMSDMDQQKKEHEIFIVKEEFLMKKRELKMALRSCLQDIEEAEAALHECMYEQQSVLLDIQTANKQLQMVEAMLDVFKKERGLREASWWKKAVMFSVG